MKFGTSFHDGLRNYLTKTRKNSSQGTFFIMLLNYSQKLPKKLLFKITMRYILPISKFPSYFNLTCSLLFLPQREKYVKDSHSGD